MAQELSGKAQSYNSAAAQAAAQARLTEGEGAATLARIAGALSAGAQHCARAAQSLVGASSVGQAFVQRAVGRSKVGGFTEAPGSDATDAGPGGHVTAHPSLRDKRIREPEWIPGSGDAYSPSLAAVSSQSHPEGWANLINGEGMRAPGRNNNCVDCARSVESTWRGSPTMAAALSDPNGRGTSSARVTEWSGGTLGSTTYAAVNQRLTELGPGSSAILASSWSDGRGGHAYNAINDGGTVKFVDGQSATVSGWPPISWSESQVSHTWAVFFSKSGDPV